MSAVAYFLTWTTYATWLHGDPRGSVDRAHSAPGAPFLRPSSARQSRAAQRCSASPFILSSDMRRVVDQAIRDHAEHRRWQLLAVNVCSNHVHVVVNCAGSHTPETAMQQFKSWGTRRLIAAGYATSDSRIWTAHGSTRYLNDDVSVMRTIDYVLNRQ